MKTMETTAVPTEHLLQFIVFNAHEAPDDTWKNHVPRGVSCDDVRRGVTARNVELVEHGGDGTFHIEGTFTVPQVVERLRASGGAPGEPPINPPETRSEPRDAVFVIRFTFEDEGFVETEVEVL